MGFWPLTGEHRHHWVFQDMQPVTIKMVEEKKGVIRIEKCFCGHYRTIEIYPGARPVIREAICDNVGQPNRTAQGS